MPAGPRPVLIASLLLLAGCGNSTTAEIVRTLAWPLPEAWLPGAPAEPQATWDETTAAAAEGEVMLRLALGSRRGLARLVQEEGDRRLWRTVGGVVVATEGARVVATAGLRQVLATSRFDGADPLTRIAEIGDGEIRGARVVDVMRPGSDPARMRFGLRLDCRLSVAATEAEDTLLVEELCRGAARFTNRFWADARSYAVFRSEQWVGDDLPPLVVEVVGPPPAEGVIPLPR